MYILPVGKLHIGAGSNNILTVEIYIMRQH